jgi:hypothetical protein
MAAVDSSTLISYLLGRQGEDVELFDAALAAGNLRIPPPVIAEVLCHPNLPREHIDLIDALPILELLPGFWHRAAKTRRALLSRGLRARLADSLIAQFCVDHNEVLIARDPDFRHFAKHCGLKLA